MGLAWEVTAEDVNTALNQMGNISQFNEEREELCDEILIFLDDEEVESAALYGNDIDTQSNYAIEEIKKQIKDLQLVELVGV